MKFLHLQKNLSKYSIKVRHTTYLSVIMGLFILFLSSRLCSYYPLSLTFPFSLFDESLPSTRLCTLSNHVSVTLCTCMYYTVSTPRHVFLHTPSHSKWTSLLNPTSTYQITILDQVILGYIYTNLGTYVLCDRILQVLSEGRITATRAFRHLSLPTR